MLGSATPPGWLSARHRARPEPGPHTGQAGRRRHWQAVRFWASVLARWSAPALGTGHLGLLRSHVQTRIHPLPTILQRPLPPKAHPHQVLEKVTTASDRWRRADSSYPTGGALSQSGWHGSVAAMAWRPCYADPGGCGCRRLLQCSNLERWFRQDNATVCELAD